jgi:hypothetical protein
VGNIDEGKEVEKRAVFFTTACEKASILHGIFSGGTNCFLFLTVAKSTEKG